MQSMKRFFLCSCCSVFLWWMNVRKRGREWAGKCSFSLSSSSSPLKFFFFLNFATIATRAKISHSALHPAVPGCVKLRRHGNALPHAGSRSFVPETLRTCGTLHTHTHTQSLDGRRGDRGGGWKREITSEVSKKERKTDNDWMNVRSKVVMWLQVWTS